MWRDMLDLGYLRCVAMMIVASAFLLDTGCEQTSRASKPAKEAAKGVPLDVSLMSLVVRPEAYEGRTVRVTGFAVFEFEHNAIYLTRDHWYYGAAKNALWATTADEAVAKRMEEVSEKWVLMEGTFRAGNRGHMGSFSGAIEEVSRIEEVLTADELKTPVELE